jgi:hypothetical protein
MWNIFDSKPYLFDKNENSIYFIKKYSVELHFVF